MTPEDYLSELLSTSASYRLTNDDTTMLATHGIKDYIFQKLSSKKFRKWAMSEACKERTMRAIELRVSQNMPLQVVFPMGGYKLWRLPSAPEIDWAEFFNLAYVLAYLAPIATAYDQPVILTYYMHTLLMEAHDNLTTDEINRYVNSFQELIAAFGNYLPNNLSVEIWKDADIYSREEYFETLHGGFKKAEQLYEELPDERKKSLLTMSKLNVKLDGKEDWTSLSEAALRDRYRKSAIYEIAATSVLAKVQEQVKADDVILVFTVPTDQFIGIGSSKTSITKYWTGFGVLEQEEDRYYPRIFSPKQYEQMKDAPHEVVPVNLIELNNLKEIWVYMRRFDFVESK